MIPVETKRLAWSRLFRRFLTLAAAVLVSSPISASWTAKPGTVKLYARKTLVLDKEGNARFSTIPAAVLERLQAEVVEEQDTFLLLQLPSASASPNVLRDIAALVEIRNDFDIVQFQSLPIDAREPAPSYPSDWRQDAPRTPPVRDAFVIQFAAPPRPAWLAELRAAGVTVLDYVPQNSYTVLTDLSTLERMVARLPIQVSRLHQPFHRVSNAIREASGSFVDVEIAIANVPEAAEVISLLSQASLAVLRSPEALGDRSIHRVTLPLSVVRELADLPAALWIDNYRPPEPSGQREAHLAIGSSLSTLAGGILKPVPGDSRQWISDRGLSGYKTALKIAILDTGFDQGSSIDVHPDFRNSSGNSFVQVVRYTNAVGSDADCNGHGTMVAGVITGNAGSSASTPTKDIGSQYQDANYYMGLGILPEMPLIVGRIFNYLGSALCNQSPPCSGDNQNFSTIYADLYNRGARIVSNSWNTADNPNYTLDAQTHDRLVRSASGIDGGPPMAVYFSAGNAEGQGANQPRVSSPATAKNVIAVGGSENFNPVPYNDPFQNTGGVDASNANEPWSLSQVGPTLGDGRIKPDLVAPASGIESVRTRYTGACRVGSAGAGIDDDASDGQISPVGQQHYWSRGTSFAAPLAAGSGALLYTWFRNMVPSVVPSPSLLKATQITFARDLTGIGFGHPPDARQGWGKADLSRAFDATAAYLWKNEEQTITGTGQLIQLPAPDNLYRIKDLTKPVKVTLVWTDAAGTVGAALMPANDLDLTVKFHGAGGSGKQALGNDFNTAIGRSNIRLIPDGTSDSKNNVEQVAFTFADVGADQFKVEVFGKAIVADGINVWTGTVPQQNFSLFIENAVANQNNASVLSQTPPPTPILGGASFTAAVLMKNEGDTTWSESNRYRLASVVAGNPFGDRVYLGVGEQIAPLSSKNFSIVGQAPFAGGNYSFQWRMVQEFIQFFGATTQAVNITVTPKATSFFTVTPCRTLDTRNSQGQYGGPKLAANTTRQFALWGQCGIPATATAVSVNLTVVDPEGNGHVAVYPANIPVPLSSTLNFKTGLARANNAVVTVNPQGKIEVLAGGYATHFLLDVNGYFQ